MADDAAGGRPAEVGADDERTAAHLSSELGEHTPHFRL